MIIGEKQTLELFLLCPVLTDPLSSPMDVLSWMYNAPSEFEYVSGETSMTHWSYPVVIGAIYMVTILGLRAFMNKSTRRIEARIFAAIHNWNMFAISLACFLGITYGTIKLGLVRPNSLRGTVDSSTIVTEERSH